MFASATDALVVASYDNRERQALARRSRAGRAILG